MPYTDQREQNLKLLRRTVTGVSDFVGRSRRTEVVYYWIASALLRLVLSFAVGTVGSFRTSQLFGYALQLALIVPMFALFVRRLHDQDKSGWWGLLLPLSLLLSIPRALTEIHGDVGEIIAQKMMPVGIAAGLCSLAVFILCLWRGTHDVNRYGPTLDWTRPEVGNGRSTPKTRRSRA